jgi:hypothetical protein
MSLELSATVDRMARRVQASDYQQWRTLVEATGGCAHPVRLSGAWQLQDTASGAVLAERSGHILAPCGNRRESICPACSDRYAADAFHLMRAGLAGGTKGVSGAVADKPRVFLTLTAPSFGPVHNRRTSRRGKVMPCACGRHHNNPADPVLGQPLDPNSYDYTSHVLWQAHAGAIWHRFTVALRRHLARAAGIRVREFGDHARLSYAKVAEYQRRGIVHFHAMIRIDGPTGTDDPAPAWATVELLTAAITAAHAATRVKTPELDGEVRKLTWGEQIDIRPIRAADVDQVENECGEITDDRLASYVAKYATKGTGKSEAADRPIRCQADIDRLSVNPHHRRIIQTAWELGDRPECDGLNLQRWAHMLAFRGHFLTKSQRYSTTFKQIRGDRRRFRHEAVLEELGVSDDSIAVINHWQMTSVGHRSLEETELALAIAEGRREQRRRKYQHERKD